MFYIIDTQSISNVRQCSVGGIEEHVCTCVILRLIHLPFKILQSVSAMFRCGEYGGRKNRKSPLFSHIGLSSLIHLFRCTVALSSTTKVFFLTRKEKSSRKLTILAAVIRSVVVNPSYWFSRVIMPKMLSLATLWEGTNTSSPFNCQPYGTYPSVQVWLSSA